jgi:hypothetical protein
MLLQALSKSVQIKAREVLFLNIVVAQKVK